MIKNDEDFLPLYSSVFMFAVIALPARSANSCEGINIAEREHTQTPIARPISAVTWPQVLKCKADCQNQPVVQ